MRSLISRSSAPRLGVTLLSLAALVGPATLPRPAFALSGLYTMVGLGYGKFTGNQLTMEESGQGNDLPETDPDKCCAKGGIGLQLRLGYSIFGVAPEVGILANGWDLGSDIGGGGIVGGGLRLYPLTLLNLAGLETADFPVDLSFGGMFGYAMAGKNFAYVGSGFDFDVLVEYKLASFVNVGLKLDIGLPSFGDFVYTDFKNDMGRCLNLDATQVTGSAADNWGRFKKGDRVCNGNGPSTTLVSPQLVFTFHFDPLE